MSIKIHLNTKEQFINTIVHKFNSSTVLQIPSAKAAPQPSHSFPPSLSQSNIEEEEDEQDDDGLVSPPAAKHSASESTAQNMNETSREVSAPEGKVSLQDYQIPGTVELPDVIWFKYSQASL